MGPSVLSSFVRRLRRLKADGGFTIVEMMVALVMFFVAVLALGTTSLVSLKDVGFARQREAATGITNQLLEEVRALAYATVAMNQNDLDTTISNGTEAHVMKTSGPTYTFRGEVIAYATVPNTEPIAPHILTGIKLGPTTFTRYVYVTYATGAASGALHVTARVTWATPQRTGVVAAVEAQTYIYASPPTSQDCESSATHPFSSPCQVFFYGTGSVDSAPISISGPISGIEYDSAQIDLPVMAEDAQIEQITALQGKVVMPGAQVKADGSATIIGEAQAVSAADSDPSTPGTAYDSHAAGPLPADAVTASGGGNSLALTLAGANTGATTSTISAGGSNTCTTQADGRPCGYGAQSQGGALDADLSLQGFAGAATLIHVGVPSSAGSAYVRRVNTGAGDGTVRETVVHNLPEVRLAGLPGGVTAPSGWAGYLVRITGYSGTAQTDAGTNSTAPSTTVTAGQVQAWNGSGYTTTNLNAAGGGVSVTSLDLSTSSLSVQISVQSLGWGASTTSQTFASGSTTTRTDVSATLGAPLLGTFTYKVTLGGDTLCDLTMNVNLGTTTAHTTYSPAPTPS